ncbi:MAG: hypothetical protein Kow0080_05550 [Candidatus Promineifilaceae bacterium]
MKKQASIATLPIVILLLAAFFRFHALEAQSFWNDEGNSARLSERPIPLIIEGTASDIHPPLYYLLLRGWREPLGESEFALRAFSAFVGVLTVAVVMAMGAWLAGSRVGVMAGWLTAVSPPLIYYSQETRMYALLALLAVLSTFALLRWVTAQNGRRWAVAYVLLLAAGLYTHYFFPAVMLVHGVVFGWMWLRQAGWVSFLPFLLAGKRPLRQQMLHWLGMVTLSLLLYAPWLPIFWRQAGGRPAVRLPLLTFLAEAVRWLAFGATASKTETAVGSWALLLLLVAALWRGGRVVWLWLLAAAVPVLFMWLAGTTDPPFYKFMVTAVPFLWLWAAQGLLPQPAQAAKNGRFATTLLTLFALTLTATGLARSLQNMYTNPAYARADYRGMVQRILAEGHPNAGIILDAPNQWEVFTYYYHDVDRVYPIPRGRPDPETIDAELTAAANRHERLYAIFWGEAQRDPERLVERWLDDHAFKAVDEWVGDVRFVMYAVLPAFSEEMETAVSVSFGGEVQLLGYTLPQTAYLAGDVVPVTLFWQAERPLTNRYKIFLHLLDVDGQLVAQRDSEPGGGLNLTTLWQPGETIVDKHGLFLPVDLQPGEYTLLLGLYDIADPAARLPLAEGGDMWELAQVVVAP